MAQSHTMSLFEAVTNVAVGFGVAVGVQLAAFPLFGIDASIDDTLGIGAIFTGVSIARGYLLRRLFERIARGRHETGPDTTAATGLRTPLSGGGRISTTLRQGTGGGRLRQPTAKLASGYPRCAEGGNRPREPGAADLDGNRQAPWLDKQARKWAHQRRWLARIHRPNGRAHGTQSAEERMT